MTEKEYEKFLCSIGIIYLVALVVYNSESLSSNFSVFGFRVSILCAFLIIIGLERRNHALLMD